MTFDASERKQAAGPIAELYDCVTPLITYRLTSYESDVVFSGNGQTYTATSGVRSSITVPDLATTQSDVTLQLPASHALAKAYVNGIPMRDLQITITRYHTVDNVWAQFWQGFASGIAYSGTTAAFRIPSGMNDSFSADVPSVVAQRLCNHVLYDSFCTINPASFQISTTISTISADGKTFDIGAATPGPQTTVISGITQIVPWALHGLFTHVPSGEKRTITGQASTTNVTVQTQFPNFSLHVGDAILVNAGCDHSVVTCALKFSNGVNHGGHPYMLPSNIFYTGLLGSRFK